MMKATLTGEPDVLRPLQAVNTAVALPASSGRIADYLELTKPRIAVMALFTVGASYLLGAGAAAEAQTLFHALVGAGLVAAGGAALNQLMERRIDARMRRTADRPLPSGRLSPEQAAAFGAGLSGAGLAYLLATVPTAAFVAAAATLATYVLVYTPLKTVTAWNTVVGAVPGALPPVIGWCAARGWDGAGTPALLFAILLLWQLPHFMAIAWMYREDYAAAGFRMVPGSDFNGPRTAAVMILTAAALLPVGVVAGLAAGGRLAAVAAAVAGVYFLARAVGFGLDQTDREARRVLRASIVYLPCVFGLILVDALLLG
jgi:protoheme IX farnesyltransferase